VYRIITLDTGLAADVGASQLKAVSLEEAGVQPTLPPPTFVLSPTFTIEPTGSLE